MDMSRAIEKLRADYPGVEFKEMPSFGPSQLYGLEATGKDFHFLISHAQSPMCAYRRMAMCCQAMK
jgi:hypothetical protein